MAGILAAIELKKAGIDVVVTKKPPPWRNMARQLVPGLSCDVLPTRTRFRLHATLTGHSTMRPGQKFVSTSSALPTSMESPPAFVSTAKLSPSCGRTRWKLKRTTVRRVPYVFAATEVLHHPNFQSSMASKSLAERFPSARWDHSVPLDGTKIAVIGTGSTAVQITSALVDSVSEFSLFQRSVMVLPAPTSSPMRSRRISK